MELEGKVAIVTGAGGAGVGGLGVAYANALADEGAAVVVSDIDGEAARHVAEQLVGAGHQAIGVAADVADEAAVIAMVDAAVEAFGGVDILVNNAGLARGRWSSGLDLSTEDWRRILDVNLLAPLVCTRACRASMASRGGGIVVNISSTGAYMETGAYGVSKLGVIGMTGILSAELGAEGTRVNAIAPGMMTAKLPPEKVEKMLSHQKLPRRGMPDDLLGTLIFLCSDRSSFITGQTILVDGGTVHGHV